MLFIYLSFVLLSIPLSKDNTVQLLGSMTEYLWRHVDNGSHDRDVVQRVGRSVFQGFSNSIRVSTSNKATNLESTFKKVTVSKMRGLALILIFFCNLLHIMGHINES